MTKSTPKLITVKQVAAILGISVPSVWRYKGEGRIPAPIQLSAGCNRWRLKEIEDWIEAQEAA